VLEIGRGFFVSVVHMMSFNADGPWRGLVNNATVIIGGRAPDPAIVFHNGY
jgi:hypothetical protein